MLIDENYNFALLVKFENTIYDTSSTNKADIPNPLEFNFSNFSFVFYLLPKLNLKQLLIGMHEYFK